MAIRKLCFHKVPRGHKLKVFLHSALSVFAPSWPLTGGPCSGLSELIWLRPGLSQSLHSSCATASLKALRHRDRLPSLLLLPMLSHTSSKNLAPKRRLLQSSVLMPPCKKTFVVIWIKFNSWKLVQKHILSSSLHAHTHPPTHVLFLLLPRTQFSHFL